MTQLFKLRNILLITFLLVSIIDSVAQKTTADTAFLAKAKKNAFKRYTDKIAEQSNLVNGVQYRDFQPNSLTTGHPFFQSDDWIDGNVFYDSGYYANVPLLYDLISDKLIVEQPFSHFKLELITEKIKYFQLAGHTFIRIVKTKRDSSITSGFYDVLYNGKVKAYAKRGKELKEDPQVGGVRLDYLNRISYLLFKDDKYYKVKSKSAVLKVFRDKKKNLKKAMKAHRGEIDFHSNRDQAIAVIAKLYDESEY